MKAAAASVAAVVSGGRLAGRCRSGERPRRHRARGDPLRRQRGGEYRRVGGADCGDGEKGEGRAASDGTVLCRRAARLHSVANL